MYQCPLLSIATTDGMLGFKSGAFCIHMTVPSTYLWNMLTNYSGKLLAGIISTQLKLHEGMEDQSDNKIQGTIYKQ